MEAVLTDSLAKMPFISISKLNSGFIHYPIVEKIRRANSISMLEFALII
jgi:hypothetical protein